MRPHQIAAGAALAALVLTHAATSPARADWRDGACVEGEGQTLVIDWRLLPDATGGTHLVRCIVMDPENRQYPDDDGTGRPQIAPLLSAGVTYSAQSFVTGVNGIEAPPGMFWHYVTGEVTADGAVWLGSEQWDQGAASDFLGITLSPEGSREAPALTPSYAAPAPSGEPTATGTPEPPGGTPTGPGGDPGPNPDPTGTGTPQPTGTQSPDPTGTQSPDPAGPADPGPEPTDPRGPQTDPPSTPPPPDAELPGAPAVDDPPPTAGRTPGPATPTATPTPRPSTPTATPTRRPSASPRPSPRSPRPTPPPSQPQPTPSPPPSSTPSPSVGPTDAGLGDPPPQRPSPTPTAVWGREATERSSSVAPVHDEAPWGSAGTLLLAVAMLGGLAAAGSVGVRQQAAPPLEDE